MKYEIQRYDNSVSSYFERSICLDSIEYPLIFEEQIVEEFEDKHGLIINFEENRVECRIEHTEKSMPMMFFSDNRIKLKLNSIIEDFEKEYDDFCLWEKAEREWDAMEGR